MTTKIVHMVFFFTLSYLQVLLFYIFQVLGFGTSLFGSNSFGNEHFYILFFYKIAKIEKEEKITRTKKKTAALGLVDSIIDTLNVAP